MTSAIRLGSRGDSYYEYLLCVHCFVYYMEYVLTAFLRKQFIQTVGFIYSAIEYGLIFINVRIEQRTFIARQVETRHNLFISPNCMYRCMRTQFKGFMITSYKRV